MAQPGKTRKVFDGRYEILSIVGRGASSVVYRARYVTPPHADLALKVLLFRKDRGLNIDRLRKEALAMVSSRHRYVIRLDDFHSVDKLCYLAMEYAPESDLRAFVAKQGGRLPFLQAERFLMQISEALGFMHQSGIVHRDVKPDNLLVINPRQIRLGDFGVATLPGEESSLEELKSGVGTMEYMPPEVFEGSTCDSRSDVYSLGLTFYEVISGSNPFAGAPLAEVLKIRRPNNFPHLLDVAPDTPPYLGGIIMRCLAYDRNARFDSGQDLLTALIAEKSRADQPKAPQVKRPGAPAVTSAPTPADPLTAAKPALAPGAASSKKNKRRRDESRRVTTPLERSNPASTPRPGETSSTVKSLNTSGPPYSGDSSKRMMPFQPSRKVPAQTPTPPESNASPPSQDHSNATAGEAPLPPKADTPRIDKMTRAPDNPPTRPQADLLRPVDRRSSGKTLSPPREMQSVPDKLTRHGTKTARKAIFWALVFTLIALFALDYGLKLATGRGVTQRLSETPQKENLLAPAVPTDDLSFPDLPAGLFFGAVSGLIPGQDHTLSILSRPDASELIVIINIEGWQPLRVLRDAQAGKELLVRGNGFVISFKASRQGTALSGEFNELVSGRRGTWSLKPAREE